MEVKQINTIVNAALSESVGTSVLLNEDLSNVVDADPDTECFTHFNIWFISGGGGNE